MVFTCAVCLDFVYDRLLPQQQQQPSPTLSSSSSSDLEPVNKQARLSLESNENGGASGNVGTSTSTSTSNSNPIEDNGRDIIPPLPTPSLGLTVQELVNFSIDLVPELNSPEPEPIVEKRKRGRPTRNSTRMNSTNNAGSSSRSSLSPLESQLKEILKPIKSDTDQIIVTHCGHIFHLVCLTRWLDSLGSVYNGHCPECKRAIRSRKFNRIYPHDSEVDPLIEELESSKEREENLIKKVEMEKINKDNYIEFRENEFKYQMNLKDDRIAEQSQQIQFLLNKLDSYKNKKPSFDCNGALIDLTDDKTIIEVDISSSESEDEMQDENVNEAINIPQTNEQGEIVID